MIQLPHDAEAAGARAESRAKLPGERPTVEISQAFKFIHRAPFGRSGGDDVANSRQAAEGYRARCPRRARSCTDQQISHRHHEFDPRDVVHVITEVPDVGSTAFRQTRSVYHGMSNKGQRTASQRVLDNPRIDVDDPVAETFFGARPAVMRLVGMQDVALTRKAVPALAPEAKRLDARKGDADRIGVVAMQAKRRTMEVSLQAFDPFGTRRDPDAIAQSFKTSPATRRYRGCPIIDRAGIAMTSQTILHSGIWRPTLTLILASVVVMGSPGPSTMSATAVGAAYGFRRSLLYACGLIVGTTAVLFAVAVGVVTLLMSIPHGAPVLVTVSAAYILYLAFRIATAPPLASQRDRVAAPTFAGGFLLAVANPKAYLAIAAVFAGSSIVSEDGVLDATVKIVLLGVMIVFIHMWWLLAGAALSRVLHNPTGSRIVNVSLAASLIVTTAITLLD
jgi:threonine/homoserine/homoserine lactone efflux protein